MCGQSTGGVDSTNTGADITLKDMSIGRACRQVDVTSVGCVNDTANFESAGIGNGDAAAIDCVEIAQHQFAGGVVRDFDIAAAGVAGIKTANGIIAGQ